MPSETVIQHLTELRTHLEENDREAVAETTVAVIEALEAVSDEETRRHNVASQFTVTPRETDADEVAPETEYGLQNTRVSVFREQFLVALTDYLTTGDPNPEYASLLVDLIDDLIEEEEEFLEIEDDVGDRLDGEQSGPLLTISRVDQQEAITAENRETTIEVLVKNLGEEDDDGALFVNPDDDHTVSSHVLSFESLDAGDETALDFSFEVDTLKTSTLTVYALSELPEDEDEGMTRSDALSRAVDSFHYSIDVELPPENHGPPVIERGLWHSFTDPRETQDYMTIGGTTGIFTVAGVTAFKRFIASDEESQESAPGDQDE